MWRNFNNPFQKYVENEYTHKKSDKKSLFFIRISEGFFLAAVLTGLLTGLFVASAQELFSRDGELGGVEAYSSLFRRLYSQHFLSRWGSVEVISIEG